MVSQRARAGSLSLAFMSSTRNAVRLPVARWGRTARESPQKPLARKQASETRRGRRARTKLKAAAKRSVLEIARQQELLPFPGADVGDERGKRLQNPPGFILTSCGQFRLGQVQPGADRYRLPGDGLPVVRRGRPGIEIVIIGKIPPQLPGVGEGLKEPEMVFDKNKIPCGQAIDAHPIPAEGPGEADEQDGQTGFGKGAGHGNARKKSGRIFRLSL
jgi:hypothetical protein